MHRSRENAKNKLYRNQNKEIISIAKTAKRARYVLTEPKTDVKEKYVQNMKKKIHSKLTLKRKLLHAFRSSRKPLARKLCNAVSNTAARKLLNKLLKVRKQSVGELLSCIRSVTALKISTEDFSKSRHTASSEPFFYDQSYAMVRHTSSIAVDSHGRCVIAEEEGKRNEKSNRPTCWKCTAECKLPTPQEVRSIMSTKPLFEHPVQKLWEALNTIDECTEHGHYSRPLNVLNSKGETLYYELAGHPLPCTSDCQSSLRVLRAAAFPQLHRLVCLLYDAIRQNRLLECIDTELCAGDLEKLLKLCAVSYGKLFSSIDSNEDSCGAADSGDAVDEPIRLQQPNLPDKYLDVLCFLTLFPSGKCGESHDRSVPISLNEFGKSHLLNKDSRFRKDPQYVFFLLWQKELRELAAGVYNLLKGRRQHVMPVGEFIDRVSNSDEDVEANLSTVFQSVRGSKQYWFLRRSEALCMLREYGSPTLFLTLSCAEYESLEISRYLRKLNKVPDSYPMGKLCTEDPISVSRKFSQKFHNFFQTVILKGEVLGPVAHLTTTSYCG